MKQKSKFSRNGVSDWYQRAASLIYLKNGDDLYFFRLITKS